MKSNYTKPLIKWIGGKTQIIDLVIKKFPREINNYHEPFLGGGCVLFALLDNIKTNKIKIKENGSINAYDFNETLINIYKNIKKTLCSVTDGTVKMEITSLDTFLDLKVEEKVFSSAYVWDNKANFR